MNTNLTAVLLLLTGFFRKPVVYNLAEEKFFFGEYIPNKKEFLLQSIISDTEEQHLFNSSPTEIFSLSGDMLKNVLHNPSLHPHYTLSSPSSNPHLTVSEGYNDRHSTVSEEMRNFLSEDEKSIIINSNIIVERLSFDIKDNELKQKALRFEVLILERRTMIADNNSRGKKTLANLYLRYENVMKNSHRKGTEMDILIKELSKIIDDSYHEKKSIEVDKAKRALTKSWQIAAGFIALTVVSLTIIIFTFLPEIFSLNIKSSGTTTDNTSLNKLIEEEEAIEAVKSASGTSETTKSWTKEEILTMINEASKRTRIKVWEHRQTKILKYFYNKKLSKADADKLVELGVTE